MRLDAPPTYGLILKLSLLRGGSKDGFRVDAVSELPDNFRQPWADVDVFEEGVTDM